ncbi:AAA family ATPase [candidate division WOR-3 bacterium]|nr:AAA family ATPase [candidate division WOR-3 bacterium]
MENAFVGRQKEFIELEKYLEEAVNFNGKAVLIKGETGVGKTTLLKKFSDYVREQNLNLLNAKSYMDDVGGYTPFIRSLEDFIEGLEFPRKTLQRIIKNDYAVYLSCLVPKIKEMFPVEYKDEEKIGNKTYLHYSYYAFISNLSKLKPVVLLIDDIQWMSSESLELLKYLVRRTHESPILIVATERAYGNGKSAKFSEKELLPENSVLLIELSNLAQNDVKKFLDAKFKSNYLNDFQNWLYSLTKGNPLFVERILEVLINRNVFKQANGEWVVSEEYKDFQIPKTLESVLGSHLSELSPVEKKIIESASVIGENFDLSILRELQKTMPQDQFTDTCENLKHLNLLTYSGTSGVFSHPLIRELIYERMKITTRRETHRRLASILKSNKSQKAEISRHLTKDLSEDEITKELALYLYEISEKFFENYDYKLAWENIKIAREISSKTDVPDEKKALLESEYNYIAWVLGKTESKKTDGKKLLRDLEKYGFTEQAAKYCRMRFHSSLSDQNFAEAEECLNKAFTFAKDKSEIHWMLSADKCLFMRRKGLLNESKELSKKLISEIPEDAAPLSLYKACSNIGLVLYLKGQYKSAREYITKALNIAKKNRFLDYISECYSNLGLIEISLGRLDSALSNLNIALEQAQSLDLDQSMGIDLFYMGNCYEILGELDIARRYYEFALQKAEKIDNSRLCASIQTQKAILLAEKGDIEDADAIIKKINQKALDKGARCGYLTVNGLLYLKKNDYDLSEKYLDEALKTAKKLAIKSRQIKALAIKNILLLKRNKKKQALESYEKTRKSALKHKEKIVFKSLPIDFGLELGGKKGEKIFFEGMDMLYDIGARKAVENLIPSMKKAGFKNALKKATENTSAFMDQKIEVYTFGGLYVKKPGEYNFVSLKEWKLAKSKELLAMLLLSSSGCNYTREMMTSELWPEADMKKGSNNFRVVLNQLINVVGEKIVLREGDTVKLDKEKLDADYFRFEKSLLDWKSQKRKINFYAAEKSALLAAEIYKGIFLPEFYFEKAVEKQRELQASMREILLWLSELNLQRLELKKAAEFAQRMLAMDSCDEQAGRIIMRCMLGQGDRIGAIKYFEFMKKSLNEEYGVEPSSETIELYKKICSDSERI